MYTRALYVGSFDPVTNNHCWMIRQGVDLFGRLIVAVGTNPGKTPRFPVDQRMELIRHSLPDVADRIEVVEFPQTLAVDFALTRGATHLIRGIRSSADLQSELDMRYVNDDIAKSRGAVPPVTVFLTPDRELAQVSSSVVAGLVGFGDWEGPVGLYVPPPVLQAFRAREVGR